MIDLINWSTKMKPNKFVGRDPLPSDKAAFERISRAFVAANTTGTAVTQKRLAQRGTRSDLLQAEKLVKIP
jgi:hypothetical protein